MSKNTGLYGYTGDLVLQDTEALSSTYFKEITKICDYEHVDLIINLESPFITDEFVSIKDKICLGANYKTVDKLMSLSPSLINLSNNHTNDYGMSGVVLTEQILAEHNFKYFGVGKPDSNNHIHYTSDSLVNVAYTLRSADQSGSRLFATQDIDGPKNLDLNEIKKLRDENKNKNLVVSIHGGFEDIKIPDFETRSIAKQIIDAGADLVIGHHSHIIQPMEIYKGKMIFYSLGNFFFPRIKYLFRDKIFYKQPLKHQRKGIVPIFDFSNGVRLHKILEVYNTDEGQIVQDLKISNIVKSEWYYQLFPVLHRKNETIRLVKYYPKRAMEKVLTCLKLKKN